MCWNKFRHIFFCDLHPQKQLDVTNGLPNGNIQSFVMGCFLLFLSLHKGEKQMFAFCRIQRFNKN